MQVPHLTNRWQQIHMYQDIFTAPIRQLNSGGGTESVVPRRGAGSYSVSLKAADQRNWKTDLILLSKGVLLCRITLGLTAVSNKVLINK